MDERVKGRLGLSFGQAEGLEPLPQQLSLGEISPEMTAAIWAIIHSSLQTCRGVASMGYGTQPWMNDPWRSIIFSWYVTKEHGLADEFNDNWDVLKNGLKAILTSPNYVKRFNFLQFVMLRPDCPHRLAFEIATIFERTRSAYRVIDRHIVPISSEEQGEAIMHALAVARAAEAQGPRTHLQAASRALSSGDWPSAVRESIHAVEGAARSIEPTADTLGPALVKLKSSIGLSPALVSAFGKLYGFTSGPDGIRHAQVFEAQTEITEREALFMFGACAAFVGYLLSYSKKLSA